MKHTTSTVSVLEARIQDLLLINEQHKILNGHLREELKLAQDNHEDCWRCICGVVTECNCKHLKLSPWKRLDMDTVLQEMLDEEVL